MASKIKSLNEFNIMDYPKTHAEVIKIWRSFTQETISKEQAQLEFELHKKLLNYFHIGEFYYYVANISTQEFTISPSVEKVLGYKLYELANFRFALEILHPDETVYFVNFEEKAMQFLASLPKEKVMNYQTQCDYRFRKKNGEYIRILHQSIVIAQYPDGTPSLFLGIHTDITHIKPHGAPILSFIGLDGEPSFINVKIDKPLVQFINHLTDREREIINLLAKGKSYKEIANTLFISTETVRRHLANIYSKLNVNSKIEAINVVFSLLGSFGF